MYYSWMNYLIKWLAAPGILAVIISIINSVYWDLKDSPLNSIYSIFVVIWASLFVVFWQRRCRGLYIEWDNHASIYQEDDVRKEFVGKL